MLSRTLPASARRVSAPEAGSLGRRHEFHPPQTTKARMCRGSSICTEFGEIEAWSRESPLPPPAWVVQDVETLAHAVRVALDGRVPEARDLVSTLRGSEAREWFVEHAQISANHRRRILRVPRPPEVAGNRRATPESLRRTVWIRDHYTCRYCNLPTIPPQTIKAIRTLLGADVLPWGNTNASRHGTLFLARSEYDHVVPVSLGGTDDLSNLVTSCPGCNYGKDRWSVEELGIEDPRVRPVITSGWDGLTGLQFAA
jgi:5-methylcytosine-specific restriction endonuclease McrA